MIAIPGPPPPEHGATPAFRRLMIFADGENLVLRYQAMVKEGWVPRDDMFHVPDAVVWHTTFSHLVRLDEVLRATYYTYVVGDDDHVQAIREQIRKLTFSAHRNSRLPRTVMPKVFKKSRRNAKGKGVDIEMTVDVLSHVHSNNVDTVLLLSGDGDYIPLIREVQRCGKSVYVSAFSDGLNPELPILADSFYCLDGTVFPKGAP
jgi:uncharacterized LabA/DUF88 family protein